MDHSECVVAITLDIIFFNNLSNVPASAYCFLMVFTMSPLELSSRISQARPQQSQ